MNNFFGVSARHAAPSLMLAFLAGCSSRHVRLVAPDTTAGSRYTCLAGEGMICQPATTDVPSDLNESGTSFVILPRECKGRFYQIMVFDAGSSKPKVEATCAPQEEPVDEMTSGAPNGGESNGAVPRAGLIAEGGK